MRNEGFVWVIGRYLKGNFKIIVANIIFIIIFSVISYLYNLDKEPFLYAFLLCFLVGIIFIIFDFNSFYKKHRDILSLRNEVNISLVDLCKASNLIEEDYQSIIVELYKSKLDIISKNDLKETEMIDYYSLWVHQIKTPIAGMRLLLQSENINENKELLTELFKIEQYVEMVLGYLNIESGADLVLKKSDLSEIVKQGVRKYSNIFIRKGISLDLKEFDYKVLTDEKWMVFVIEQLLSNALKYTTSGKISIYIEDNSLVIEDTGMGISEEDLPRIFEKGFTGYNGRMDKKASGIGLYLCKRVLNKLGHKISITSAVGIGTKVSIDVSSVVSIIE